MDRSTTQTNIAVTAVGEDLYGELPENTYRRCMFMLIDDTLSKGDKASVVHVLGPSYHGQREAETDDGYGCHAILSKRMPNYAFWQFNCRL